MAVRKEIVRNTKGMRKRLGHSIGYGKKETVHEEALPYLKEHQQELTDRIYRGKYTPSPVRRVEIPKPDGGVRKLGIPTVIDRTLHHRDRPNTPAGNNPTVSANL